MNPRTKITLGMILVVGLAGFFTFALPSLIGFLLTSLLLIAAYDIYLRRQRHVCRTFNSALRAVCHRSGGISRIATAFAKAGPLRGPSYEFARRMMGGQEPVQAAADAGVPLQLSTAVAMLTAPNEVTKEPEAHERKTLNSLSLPSGDSTSVVSAYSQVLYLTMTGLVTCGVLIYVSYTVVPMIEMMFDEFGMKNRYGWLISGTSPAWILLGVLGLLLFGAALVLSQSDRFRPPFLRRIPVSPRLAESKEDILCGLADAIDVGMPLDESLNLASRISLNYYDKSVLSEAARLIQRGVSSATALHQVGLVDACECDWLDESNPSRFAQLLRHFGHQEVRDACANVRWMMAVLFPFFVALLGAAVLAYSYGFFGTLMSLVTNLS